MGSERKLNKQKTKTPQPQRKPSDKQSDRGTQAGASNLANLQQQVGNRAVQLLVAQRSGGGQDAYTLDERTAGRIKQERGGGQPMEDGVQGEMSQAMGRDLGDVRVHEDAEADRLSRQVDARAFTVGKDVFFRRGEYTPHSSEGKELLAHELTHVVDQSEGRVEDSGSGTTVHAPDDAHEQKADAVAKRVASPQPAAGVQPAYTQSEGRQAQAVQRQDEPEEELETKAIQRQDEEEELEMKAVQRQEEPEEELEMKAVQRQDEPEEELEMKAVQRQDEEELEMKGKT